MGIEEELDMTQHLKNNKEICTFEKLAFLQQMHACMLSHFSCVQLCATLWTVTHQAPLSMELSRQEYWSGLPFPSPGDLPDPGINPRSPALQADALTSETFA